jgi:hypothetical protein
MVPASNSLTGALVETLPGAPVDGATKASAASAGNAPVNHAAAHHANTDF